MHVFVLMLQIYMKAQKHACFHVFSQSGRFLVAFLEMWCNSRLLAAVTFALAGFIVVPELMLQKQHFCTLRPICLWKVTYISVFLYLRKTLTGLV